MRETGGHILPNWECRMSRMMLMESILGHMALLAEKYPKKASSQVAKRAKRAAKMALQPSTSMKIGPAAKPLRRAA